MVTVSETAPVGIISNRTRCSILAWAGRRHEGAVRGNPKFADAGFGFADKGLLFELCVASKVEGGLGAHRGAERKLIKRFHEHTKVPAGGPAIAGVMKEISRAAPLRSQTLFQVYADVIGRETPPMEM